MTGDFGVRHREAHVGEEPKVPSLPDVPLGLQIGGSRRRSYDVELQFFGKPLKLGSGHMRDCAQ